MKKCAVIVVLIINCCLTYASNGDRSPFFQSCVKGCRVNNCTTDGVDFITDKNQDFMYKLLAWSCYDECVYECMWKTTLAFLDRKWNVPQFYGKWPFIRCQGFQEPASVIFSVWNLLANLYMIKKFRLVVRKDSPNYWLWHFFAAVCCNAWTWSTVFHARDFPLTEIFDYGFAYSMVLASFYCMIIRMIFQKSILIKSIVSLLCLLFFINHFAYLSVGQLDYKFNMKINVITGIIGGSGWLAWYVATRKKRKYAWKMLTFQVLAAASLLLELNDFPPLFYVFDAHSLWHLATVPLTFLFYSFAIDDCQSLRRELRDNEEEKKLI